MTINGFNIKKYRTKVKDSTSVNGYKIVEGYVSISAVVWHYEKPDQKPIYVPIFTTEEIDLNSIALSGFGKSVCKAVTYYSNEFEIVGEVE